MYVSCLYISAVIYSVEPFGCPRESDNFYGFNWPSTKGGEVAIVNCSVRLDMTFATRLCNTNGVWGTINVSNCESDTYSSISIMVCKSHYEIYHICSCRVLRQFDYPSLKIKTLKFIYRIIDEGAYTLKPYVWKIEKG